MSNSCEIFARRLRARRTELGLTQKELAAALGYSEKTVSKWESGGVIAPSAVLVSLARALKTDVGSLLADKEESVYYLGVDGGGTKTDFALEDSEGRVIRRVTLEGSNPNDIGMRATADILARGIAEVCRDIPLSQVYAFFGIAGGTAGDNRDTLGGILAKHGFAAYDNGNDAMNAVSLALGDGDGSVMIMGTGSVVFSQLDRVLHRRGGYGYLFERGASGFSIGRDAIMHALALEERGESDRLCELVGESLGAERVCETVAELYVRGKRAVAAVAPAVFTAFYEGDAAACEIIERNMAAAARLIESAPRREGAKWRVVIVGGLAKDERVILPIIYKNLTCPENYELLTNLTPPYVGALRLARRLKEGLC